MASFFLICLQLFSLYTGSFKRIAHGFGRKSNKRLLKNLESFDSSQLLVHFDPTLPIVLAYDVSAYGIGAVLAHRMPDDKECPIGNASRALSTSECNYLKLEKEDLLCLELRSLMHT